MTRILPALTFACLMLFTVAVEAQVDRVRTTNGSKAGEVVGWNNNNVQLETNTGITKYQTPEVISVIFANEPTELSQARINLENKGYLNAKELLSGVKLGPSATKFLKEDFAFMKTECLARLAIAGRADARVAGRELVNFQKAYPDGFHSYRSAETTGDLLVSLKRYDQAVGQYRKLSKAPWPAYQVRSLLLSAQARQLQGKHSEAINLLKKANSIKGKSTSGSRYSLGEQQFLAKLTLAKNMAADGKKKEAISALQKMILAVDEDATDRSDRLAHAYAALGYCYAESGKLTDALLAYLRVDYLYSDNQEAHAEALYHLHSLWNRSGEARTAQLTKSKLLRMYGTSRWARE